MPIFSPTQLSRRTAVKLAMASALLSSCAPKTEKPDKHVAVIGGGIVGASIAYHLAKEGIKVTLLDRNNICTRASRGTFAWINATWAKQPRHYHAFNQDGLMGWKRVQADLNIPIRWTGSLEWFASAERQVKLANQIEEQIKWGEPAEMLDRQGFTKLEPQVDFGPVDLVAYSPNDGAVNPVLASSKFVDAAKAMGAVIKTNCPVDVVETLPDGRSELITPKGNVIVDQYVIATGSDPYATEQLAGLIIPQRSTPGVIVVTKPHKRLINRIIVAPGVHIHQRDDGCIVLGEQDGAPQTETHNQRLTHRPNQFPSEDIAQQHAWRILGIAEQYVPDISEVEVDNVYIGWRPLPLDGHPVLGTHPETPNAYLAIMHSGVSLAPIVGELAAKEIALGISSESLNEYRPTRPFEKIQRY
ncbi:MAG: FAD-dependent oxidoreductase [Litorimonas sp.]